MLWVGSKEGLPLGLLCRFDYGVMYGSVQEDNDNHTTMNARQMILWRNGHCKSKGRTSYPRNRFEHSEHQRALNCRDMLRYKLLQRVCSL